MGDFSGKINKLSCNGVVVGRCVDLSALVFSTLAAYLGGGMNCGAITQLSEVYLVCWAKNRRLVLNAVKPNVYRATYLHICFNRSTQHMFIPLWLRSSCSPVGLGYALCPPAKTTLPPLNSSLQSATCYLRFGTGLAHG